MSIYELVDYDSLLTRVGITPGEEWFCGANPPENYNYDDLGVNYDDIVLYDGRSQSTPGGLCLNADVNVNGLVLNTRDANGTLWLCTGIDGWWTLPPSEIPDVPKPYWEGSMLTTGRYLTRTITVSGCFIPPGPEWVWYNRDAILRCCGLVRGVGLLAMCGNESPSNPENFYDVDGNPLLNPFFDPPKMTIIQTADVPLVDTVRPNGFTQFSLSFRCVYSTKQSIKENDQVIPVPAEGKTVGRAYAAFSTTEFGWLPYDDPANKDTTYEELQWVLTDNTLRRKYSDVKFYNPDSPIKDEAFPREFAGDFEPEQLVFHNAGNYFAFPTIVIEETAGVSTATSLKIINETTHETLELVKNVPANNKLVVDSLARRVALVPKAQYSDPGTWDWNARDYLALDSEWISLASGDNQFLIQKDPTVFARVNAPTMYWRDSWIG
jgi:hypothetical protein